MEPQASDSKTYGQRFERARTAQPEAEQVTPDSPASPQWLPQPQPQPVAPEPSLADAAQFQSIEPAAVTLPGDWGWEIILSGVLYFLASAVGLLGVFGGLFTLSQATLRGLRGEDWLIVGMWIIGGLGGAGVLIASGGLLTMVGRHRRQVGRIQGDVIDLAGRVDQLARQVSQPPPRDTQAEQRLADVPARIDKLSERLDEIAHNSLLDEAGRAQKRRQMLGQQRDAAIEAIRREMAQGRWDRAQAALERFRANYPADGDHVARLSEELTRRREQAEGEDVAVARGQCDELMGILAWDRAAQVALSLVQRHPESTAAKALLTRIDRERKVAEEQQRQAMYGQIQRHASRREWIESVQVANRLISQFPQSIEAEAIKAQMETLVSNAEIQRRQAMEGSIKDLVKRQRFEEALALAEELISAYPNSPQAVALRGSIDQLREKAVAAAEDARRRRVQWQ